MRKIKIIQGWDYKEQVIREAEEVIRSLLEIKEDDDEYDSAKDLVLIIELVREEGISKLKKEEKWDLLSV